jgi:hypothetical protein
MEPGLIVMVVIVVVFYMRLYLMRRGRKRRENIKILKEMKQGRKAPKMEPGERDAPYRVKNWFILVPGVVLLLAALAVYTNAIFPEYQPYWWVLGAAGGILFMFSFE